MHAELLVIAVVLVLGIAAFIFGVLHVLWRGMFFAVRLIFGRHSSGNGRPGPPRLVCPRRGCRKVEYRDAIYCSQCGARLVERVSGPPSTPGPGGGGRRA